MKCGIKGILCSGGILKSFFIAGLTTFLCICIAYPFSLSLRKKAPKVQSLCMVLIILPFLTNSLIRIYGFIVLLRKNGIVNNFLLNNDS